MSTLNFEPFARIEELENRIEQLEAALRKIAELEYLTDEAMQKIAEDALDQSSPPKATPEIGTEILLSGDFEITRE